MTSQTKKLSVKKILKEVGCLKLNLVKGKDYWYFIYDDEEANKYDTSSVYVMTLNEMSLDRWVEEGKELVAKFN